MKEQVITNRLKDLILAIENTLGLDRQQFSRSNGKSYRYGWKEIDGKPVKSSSRYIYKIGEKGDTTYTLSIGFYFLQEQYWEVGRKLPLEEQYITVSYASVKSLSGRYEYPITSDDYYKEITSSEKLDLNEAKSRLKMFKNELIHFGKGANTPYQDIIEIFERVFLKLTKKDEKQLSLIFKEKISPEVDTYAPLMVECNKAEVYYNNARSDYRKELADSYEQKEVHRLELELKNAKVNLATHNKKLRQKHRLSKLEKEFREKKSKWEDAFNKVKKKGIEILTDINAPFRFNKIIDDMFKKQK